MSGPFRGAAGNRTHFKMTREYAKLNLTIRMIAKNGKAVCEYRQVLTAPQPDHSSMTSHVGLRRAEGPSTNGSPPKSGGAPHTPEPQRRASGPASRRLHLAARAPSAGPPPLSIGPDNSASHQICDIGYSPLPAGGDFGFKPWGRAGSSWAQGSVRAAKLWRGGPAIIGRKTSIFSDTTPDFVQHGAYRLAVSPIRHAPSDRTHDPHGHP